jgi:hypothetical protein
MKRVGLLLVACGFLFSCDSYAQRGAAFSAEEQHNDRFSIRVTGFREKRSFGQVLAGAYYVFESKTSNEIAWKEFLVVKQDDPEPISKDSLAIVDENTGYVFMFKQFAVTTNAGNAWSIWSLSNIDVFKTDRSCWIQKVTVTKSGMGSMNIKCNESSYVLSTEDFGVSWKQ